MLGLDMATLIARAIVLLVAFTIHELAHAVTADRMGDPTPRRMGRITLNPLAHLDPIGTILLLVSGFGWAKPVMVNPMNLRGNPRTGMAIVAAAGPISNVIMAVSFALPFQLGLVGFSAFGGFRMRPLEQYGFLILMFAIFILPMLGIDLISNLIMVPSSMVLSFLIGL